MKRVILQKRIYWWRFFFDTLRIVRVTYREDGVLYEHPYVRSICRMIVPCSDKYRPPKARNDNGREDRRT